MRSTCVPAALAAAMSTAVPAHAAGEWPDSPNRLWFENLERPDNHLAPERWRDPKSLYCCGIADTVKTRFKVEPGDSKHPDDRWYAWLKEKWVAIYDARGSFAGTAIRNSNGTTSFYDGRGSFVGSRVNT